MGHLSSQDFSFPIPTWGRCKDKQTNRAAHCADSSIRPLGCEIPAWLPVGCVALGTSLDLSELQFPRLQNQNRNSPSLLGLVWGSTETLHTQCSGEWLTECMPQAFPVVLVSTAACPGSQAPKRAGSLLSLEGTA